MLYSSRAFSLAYSNTQDDALRAYLDAASKFRAVARYAIDDLILVFSVR